MKCKIVPGFYLNDRLSIKVQIQWKMTESEEEEAVGLHPFPVIPSLTLLPIIIFLKITLLSKMKKYSETPTKMISSRRSPKPACFVCLQVPVLACSPHLLWKGIPTENKTRLRKLVRLLTRVWRCCDEQFLIFLAPFTTTASGYHGCLHLRTVLTHDYLMSGNH